MSELPMAATPPAVSRRLLLATFITAIFVSAALLFAVQPLFTKMVLPQLGGAAAVWSVAMVFFQTMLLAGYAYAHLLTRFAPGRTSMIVHLAVTIVACFALPLHSATNWGLPPSSGEAFWLLGLFTVSIGLPFFALAANGPLLQAWFARTDHPAAKDPYFLYAASNIGSFLALLSYPVVVEPFVRLGDQTWAWTGGFYVMIALLAACGLLMLRSSGAVQSVASAAASAAPRWRDAAIWVVLAAVPSGLLVAVTAHIATDVAAVPLLWVAPLALYLLTFVIAFQGRPIIPHRFVVAVQPFVILVLVVFFLALPATSIVGLIALHLAVLFFSALMCHGELARRRPAAEHLTAFYMWISVGGMLGGMAAGLIAPHVFNWVAEYPILIVLALLCRPGLAWPRRGTGEIVLLVILGLAVPLAIFAKANDVGFTQQMYLVMVGGLLGLIAKFWRATLPYAAIIAFLLFAHGFFNDNPSVFKVRNFFGVLNVVDTPDGKYRVLWHGTTAQGTQQVRDDEGNPLEGRPEMIAEFQPDAGIAQTMNAVHAKADGKPIDFAVIGLGTGALACQVRPGDTLTYYEIDPDVARIARDPAIYQYISGCAPETKVVLGDARLKLADAPDGAYDLIFVDAFIGAAIPIHLLTREAIALYFKKLKPNGIVAMHISNLNLELASVAAGVAEANGAVARIYDGGDAEVVPELHLWVPRVAAIARKEEDFGALAKSVFWPVRKADPNERVWTDDYSNIVGALLRRMRERAQMQTN